MATEEAKYTVVKKDDSFEIPAILIMAASA
jgi:hypothetical protein